jgi:hypothetical protein
MVEEAMSEDGHEAHIEKCCCNPLHTQILQSERVKNDLGKNTTDRNTMDNQSFHEEHCGVDNR